MDSALYVALSSQVALEKRLTTLADNVANANTVGYRATEVKFEQLVDKRRPADVAFVSSGENYLSTDSGGLKQTGNALDFAVQGDGWFAIETPSGMAQLDSAGGEPEVARDGGLRQNGALLGAIGLFAFDPADGYARHENSAILPAGEPEAIVDRFDVGVVQGFVENSNVNALAEMTQLIMVTRQFENISALIRDSEGVTEQAIRTLGGSNT
jgi:flagellar basal-body rod protein FlgF